MLLHHSHSVLPALSWPEPSRTITGERNCDGTSADLRAYMRSFAAPMAPIAVVALVCVLAAFFMPLV